MPGRVLVLVKHATPVLDGSVPAREWRLSAEGVGEARRLAERLRPFAPLRLVCSDEPKALHTAQLAAAGLGVTYGTNAALREIDRAVLPIMTPEQHRRLNREIFTQPERAVLGSESAADARARFQGAVADELKRTVHDNLAVITHGTVIALFVAAHNAIDAYALWTELTCASFVVLTLPDLQLVARADGPEQDAVPIRS